MNDSRSTIRAIQAAATEEQVVAVVRDFLKSLSPSEAALMPAGLTALGVSHVEEVFQSALALVHREMGAAFDQPEAAVLKDASLVLSTAAQRLAILAKHPGEKSNAE